MNQYLKYIGIGLLIVFILWNIISVFLYTLRWLSPNLVCNFKLSPNPEGTDFQQANVIHLTQGGCLCCILG